ncbi:hypothetical protein IAU60_001565 [Kwoniella sp. DSM 27419]
MPIVRAKPKEYLRVGFIHPDLGIGGAERLVVDAAVSLKRRGHDVVMFTSRHDPNRCFVETKDGTLPVHVLGSSIPRSLHPKYPMTIICSMLRSFVLTLLLCLSLYLPEPATWMNPLSPIKPFDIYFVDQQSVCVPLLRLVTGTRVVFYCHFPDKLLSGGWEIGADKNGQVERKRGQAGGGVLKRIYRWPIDKLEEFTTGQSDIVLSNSHFTSRIYARAFPSLAKRPPRVVYPCIDIDAYKPASDSGKGARRLDPEVASIASDRPTILSFNRFEAKKNTALAIKAFAKLHTDKLVPQDTLQKLRLVIGGGYDKEEADNVKTLSALEALCKDLHLRYHVLASSKTQPPADVQVLFILNFSNAQRTHLLTSPNTKCLLYTPANEHFGIVPIEAMSCGLPVLAANSGGPTETIIDIGSAETDGTGLLRSPTPEEWAPALASLVALSDEDRAEISAAGRKRVEDKFSLSTLGQDLEAACKDALKKGDLHDAIGDAMIWGGAVMVAFSVVCVAGMIWMNADL